jgi:hypothetical protein
MPKMELPDRAAVLEHLDTLVAAEGPARDHGRARDSRPAVCVVHLEGMAELRQADPAGTDAALAEVVRRLDRLVRSGDVIAELAPDRLALVVRISPVVAGALVERVAGAVAMPLEVAGSFCSLATVLGVAFARDVGPTWGPGCAEDLVAAAESDVARQLARRSGD